MTLSEFTEGIKLLKKMFPTWQLDVEDPQVLEIWFIRCKGIKKEQFKNLIKWYCSHKDFPPRSPNELATSPMEIYREQFPTKNEMKNTIRIWLKLSNYNYETAMKSCPDLIDRIPISYYAFDNLCNGDSEAAIASLLEKWVGAVDAEVQDRARKFLKGEIRLPFTTGGRLVTYNEECVFNIDWAKPFKGLPELEKPKDVKVITDEQYEAVKKEFSLNL